MRAKTINEIRRSTDTIGRIGVGTGFMYPAFAYVRDNFPECITQKTITDVANEHTKNIETNLFTTGMHEFETSVGNPDDFVVIEFEDKTKERQFYEKFFERSTMEEIMTGENTTAGGKPIETFGCYYDEVNCVGSMDVDHHENDGIHVFFVRNK